MPPKPFKITGAVQNRGFGCLNRSVGCPGGAYVAKASYAG
jgi:hypothetical protein